MTFGNIRTTLDVAFPCAFCTFEEDADDAAAFFLHGGLFVSPHITDTGLAFGRDCSDEEEADDDAVHVFAIFFAYHPFIRIFLWWGRKFVRVK